VRTDTTAEAVRTNGVQRRLVLVIGAVVFVDTLFYAVISPLLPQLVHELHLSKLSAGVMTACYPIGTLAGSIPGGLLAARAGPKPTVLTGLALLAASTVAFALLHNAAGLDAARIAEGLGGACSWAGGMAWIVAETTSDRRGALIGRTLGAAIGGALFGPVLGALAELIGRAPAFSGIVVVALALMVETQRLPTRHVDEESRVRDLFVTLRGRGMSSAMWLVTLPALVSGAISVLAPLRLHRFGASAAIIGLTFLLAAAIESAITPAIGGISDRRGRMLPVRVGLLVTGALLLCFTLPRTTAELVVLVVATAAALGGFWAPAMAMMADAADRHGLQQGLAAALMNLAWAAGQIGGSAGGGAVAKVTGDALPMGLAAFLCLGTLALIMRRRDVAVRAEPSPHG
jgi:MFS family permease